ncbi:MAG: transketolase [Candidatus Diapherotrites archaeon]
MREVQAFQEKLAELKEIARKIRVLSLKMTSKANSGHPGGSLSEADILAALFFHEMKINPANPRDPERDRFVLSKGHASPGLYSALALKGIISMKELDGFREINCMLQGHPSRDTPGIETIAGSLGQGFSVACGMALAAKMDGKNHKVFVVLGDGEIQEGIVWESALFAAHYNLKNLIAIVDANGCQNDGYVKDIMQVEPIKEKFEAFGWNTLSIDGHDLEQIIGALEKAKFSEKPIAIIARTIKGKGVSFMENDPQWHGKALNAEQLQKALKELGEC